MHVVNLAREEIWKSPASDMVLSLISREVREVRWESPSSDVVRTS
jgi:hypothetical protein